MEADEYVAECIMRDLLAIARARAVRAPLEPQRIGDQVSGPGITRRLVELGRLLVDRCRPKRAKTPRGAAELSAQRSGR